MVQSSESKQSEGDFFENSAVYREFCAERDEILKHKYFESEKAGHDIGFEKALLDWIVRHRAAWRAYRRKTGGGTSPESSAKAA